MSDSAAEPGVPTAGAPSGPGRLGAVVPGAGLPESGAGLPESGAVLVEAGPGEGAAVVAAVRARLADLPEDVHEHAPVYDDVHRLLQDALSRLDEG